MSKVIFRKKLEDLINVESMERGSDTPDFILADYLTDCLDLFDRMMAAREKWYGRDKSPLSYEEPPPPPGFSKSSESPTKQERCVYCHECGQQLKVPALQGTDPYKPSIEKGKDH